MKNEQNPSYLIFILILSILALVALGVETFFDLTPAIEQILGVVDTAVCIVFFIDFLIQFFRAEKKIKYLYTWGWLDLISSVPLVEVFRLGRAIRIIRIFRVLRTIKSAKIITKAIIEKRTQSLVMVVVLTAFVLIAVSSISILHFEESADGNIKTAEDAIWWSVVTITTVGYGDKFPITTEGRIIATFLMTFGIGLFGTVSGVIASYFLLPSQQKEEENGELRKELEEIKLLLNEMKKEQGG